MGMKTYFFFEHHVNSYFAGAHLILRESLAGDSVNVIFNGNIPQQINSAAAGKQQFVFTQQKIVIYYKINKCKLRDITKLEPIVTHRYTADVFLQTKPKLKNRQV